MDTSFVNVNYSPFYTTLTNEEMREYVCLQELNAIIGDILTGEILDRLLVLTGKMVPSFTTDHVFGNPVTSFGTAFAGGAGCGGYSVGTIPSGTVCVPAGNTITVTGTTFTSNIGPFVINTGCATSSPCPVIVQNVELF